MSFIFSLFYDSIMDVSEKACLGRWRQELIQDL
ncbi:MAG: methyltransferase type 11, partial [Gammaproteobacteria bacterium]|nr:methyltransferase type 11 [Gammaproteobacteria bacterium]